MSTFDFTTSTLTFEAIQGWKVETVEAFLRFKQKDFSLSDAEIQKCVDCSFNGTALLKVNKDGLMSFVGLRYGPALNVMRFFQILKNQSKKRHRVTDNTPEFCRQIATPFESLPSIPELKTKTILLKPFNRKIPLEQNLYTKCELSCYDFPISDYFVKYDEEHAYSPIHLSVLCYIALQGTEVGSSKSSRIGDWDSLIRNPTSVLRKHFDTKHLWDADREEKSTDDGLIDAKRLLISKMKTWSPSLYGDLKYILAYAAGGAQLQFYAIDPSLNLHVISDRLNLDNLQGRVEALICIFNIHRIIRSMKSLLPETVVPVWKLFKRTYGDIFIADTQIEKRIHSFSAYPFSNMTVLKNIYRDTKDIKNIIHAVSDPWIDNNSYKVILAPVGINRTPRTEQEVKAAIRCVLNALVGLHKFGYVHRDVCWPNILQLTDNSWMLIDLECAGTDDESVNFDPLKDWAPEVIETKKYTKKADVYMVGRLLRNVFISLSEKAYEFERATTAELDSRLTAQEALQHPWLSNAK
ncbi:hypothetical protein C2G38_2256821 [Gigaspora rosea]|uniref:Protein kinase domain-containing protein n=1 Tax=Gigaspora rosea TaxID=44941 RepID=A0A397TU34_9GLOM|nr:hypothetical protein C2G38_2256821 [Gigaspora rosea]